MLPSTRSAVSRSKFECVYAKRVHTRHLIIICSKKNEPKKKYSIESEQNGAFCRQTNKKKSRGGNFFRTMLDLLLIALLHSCDWWSKKERASWQNIIFCTENRHMLEASFECSFLYVLVSSSFLAEIGAPMRNAKKARGKKLQKELGITSFQPNGNKKRKSIFDFIFALDDTHLLRILLRNTVICHVYK